VCFTHGWLDAEERREADFCSLVEHLCVPVCCVTERKWLTDEERAFCTLCTFRKEAKRPELDLIWEKTERRDVKFFVIYLSFSSQLSSLVVP
jgi:hypothetical protein